MPPVVTKGTGLQRLSRALGRFADRVVRSEPAVRRPSISRAAIETLEDRKLLSTTFYVAPGGSDSAPGTSLTAPFRTIQKAASLAEAGDTVLIRGGTYRETITPARSGTGSAPITFKPYNGERVVVSGADAIRGFGQHAGNVFKTPMGWDLGYGRNQVFVNGQMMLEARWPNTTIAKISDPPKARADIGTGGGNTSGTVIDADLSAFPSGSLKGAMISVTAGWGWLTNTGTISSHSGKSVTFSLSKSLAPTVGAMKAGNEYFISGSFKLLDSAGEWFRDASGQLYLWAPGGGDPDAQSVEVKRRTYAFNLDNKSHIRLEDINIFAASVKTGWNSTGVVLDGLDMKYVSHFTQVAGAQAIWSLGNRDTGIELRGSNNRVINSVIAYSAGNGVSVQGNGNVVQNNIIRDINYTALDNAAVWTSGSGIRITGNTMYNSGRSLIKHNGSPGIKIMYNRLYNACLQTNDGGATYTYSEHGAGAEIAYNVVSGVRTETQNGGVGIYLDRYSENWNVHHNLVYDCDESFKTVDVSRNNKIINNTFVGEPKSVSGWRNLDYSGTVFRNNIFTGVMWKVYGTLSNNLYSGTDFRFTNAAARNYTLQSGSPAINKGVQVAGITTTTSPDIGAFEYGVAAWRAGDTISESGGGYVPPSTPTTVPTPTPTPTGTISARSIIQAESYVYQSGIVRKPTYVTDTDHGNWIRFNRVDFGTGVSRVKLSLAVDNAQAGGRIEFRVGSASGTLIGSYTTVGTGGWQSWREVSTSVAGTTGVKDLFVVFKSTKPGDVANLSWVQFA